MPPWFPLGKSIGGWNEVKLDCVFHGWPGPSRSQHVDHAIAHALADEPHGFAVVFPVGAVVGGRLLGGAETVDVAAFTGSGGVPPVAIARAFANVATDPLRMVVLLMEEAPAVSGEL